MTTINTSISTLSSEAVRDITDLSNILHSRIFKDISDVIGGAGESLDTLRELEVFITSLSGDTVTGLVSNVTDLSGRENTHYTTLSTTIVNLDSSVSSDISDLSSLTFNKSIKSPFGDIDKYLLPNIPSLATFTVLSLGIFIFS